MAEGTRYFEFCGGTSSKFWEITLQGSSYTVRYGRVGHCGQTVTKKFASSSVAKAAANTLMVQKHRKGYEFVPSGASSQSHTGTSSAFSSYLREIERIYQTHDQNLQLREPADVALIRRVEEQLGSSLDVGLAAAWASGNGTEDDAVLFCRPGYLTAYAFVSIDDALHVREIMKKRAKSYGGYVEPEPRDRRINPEWFQPGWLPFASSASGLFLFQDYSPSKDGSVGQISAFTHDPDQITFIASSFDEFLAASLNSFREDPEEVLGLF